MGSVECYGGGPVGHQCEGASQGKTKVTGETKAK